MDNISETQKIIDWLVQHRTSLGMSQQELAESMGILQSQVSKIENSVKQLEFSEYIQICRSLNLDPALGIREVIDEPVDSILATWEIDENQLTKIVTTQPSLRGMLLGYVAEHKLAEFMDSHPEVTNSFKHDDHDRKGKGDRVILYKGHEFIIECKSLQTNTVKESDGVFTARAQVDASDRREVFFDDGSSVTTTCLKTGEFDILAINTFAFGKGWNFLFANNSDLPRSKYKKYSESIKSQLLATTVKVSWPTAEPFSEDLFQILDDVILLRESH